MKKGKIFFLLALCLLLADRSPACPMEPPGKTDIISLSNAGEKIVLYTDRSLYCVGESIYFTAAYSCIVDKDSPLWSKVLYVELIRWDGSKLAQKKLKLDKSGSSGSLKIPGHLLSGNYYLRAYTKWMRNFSVRDYGYQAIKIVNPLVTGTDPGPAETSGLQESSLSSFSPKQRSEELLCTVDKKEYGPGEKVSVNIAMADGKINSCDNYCVSVAKAGLLDSTLQSFKPGVVEDQKNSLGMEYLPEIKGVTVSGKVLDKTSSAPDRKVLLSLSAPINGVYFSVYETNDQGRFVFSLPDMYGSRDFFIQKENGDKLSSEILIDHGFCNKAIVLPYLPFELGEEEQALVRDMIINQQLREKFSSVEDAPSSMEIGQKEPLVFYGSHKQTYFTKDYIELPNIEEFFVEIVREFVVVYDKEKNFLKNKSRTSFSNFPPLILLDNVPVSNDERLLSIALSKIERVEVIDRCYMAGKGKYDGLISIYSKKKNFAGIDLNKNSLFFTYELFSDERTAEASAEASADSRIPNRKNLLYWDPETRLSPDSNTSFSFYTSDSKGEYVVYIRAKDPSDYREIYGIGSFIVK